VSLAIKAARRATRAMPGAAGDPGLLGGILGAFKGGLKNILGGPAAVVSGAAGGFREGFKGPASSPVSPIAPPIGAPVSIASQVPTNGRMNGRRMVPVLPKPGVIPQFERLFPGGATGLEVAINGNGACPSGSHPNKSDYFLKTGEFVAKGSRCVKNRRRNPLNPRALTRAVARIDAGKIWQGKLHEISTGKFTAAGTRKTC